ncbi:MAG: pectate lyase [Bacteroidota bacterium]
MPNHYPRQLIGFLLLSFYSLLLPAQSLQQEAQQALETGVAYFASIHNRGGYVFHYSLDLQQQWGEAPLHGAAIEVQPPGTPAVGMVFLQAYQSTGDSVALLAAMRAATALIQGQNEWGGWGHTIRFQGESPHHVSFDDDQTQSAIRFLMAMDASVSDDSLHQATLRALELMLKSQLPLGGWPHRYPRQGNYHDYATYNDGGMRDCIQLMRIAAKQYEDPRYRASLEKAGRYLMRSQLPPPSPGWAQQYNEFLAPAWARSFEPPSVCPSVSLDNCHLLMDLYLDTGRKWYLEAIPDAIRWMETVRLPNGKWPRFVELYTNEPLYYDRDRIAVDSLNQLSDERRLGYRYEQNLANGLAEVKNRFQSIRMTNRESMIAWEQQPAWELSLEELETNLQAIIQEQDEQGRWITYQDKFKHKVPGQLWDGTYQVQNRISSQVFIRNVQLLCEYLERVRQ